MRLSNLFFGVFVCLILVGGVVGAETESILGDGEDIIASATNAEVVRGFNENTVTLNDGGSIEINGVEFPVDSSAGKINKFIFGSDGKLLDGTRFVSNKGKFVLKGWEYNFPKGVVVEYKGGEVVFNFPVGEEIVKPVAGDGADENAVFIYESSSAETGIKLPNGLIIGGRDGGKAKVYADGNGFYLGKDGVVVKTGDGKDGLLVNVPDDGRKVYFASNVDDFGDEVDYIYVGDGVVILNSPEGSGRGVSAFVLPDNEFGIAATPQNTVAAQAANGKAIIRKSDTLGKLADVRISGESIADLDGRSIFAFEEKMYFYPKDGLIDGFERGYYDADVKVTLIDKSGKAVEDFSVYSNGRDQYASVSEGDLESGLEYVETSEGFFVSNSVSFNRLSPDAQKFYSGLSDEEQKELIDEVNVGSLVIHDEGKDNVVKSKINQISFSKGRSAMLQKGINRIIEGEIKKKQNPYSASAKLSSGGAGGSATFIGTDKEGHPIALTAGHVVRTPGRSVKLTINTDEGLKTYTGKVVGGTHVPDVAVLRMDQVDFDVPYVSIASKDEISVGDLGLRMGYPSYKGRKFEAINTKIIEVGDGRWEIEASEEIGPYPGSSGGAVFVDGKLGGITSQTPGWGSGIGKYTGPEDIGDILIRHGYDYLINIIKVLLKLNYGI